MPQAQSRVLKRGSGAEYKRIYNLNKVIWLPQPMLEDDDYRLGILDEKEDGTPVFGMSFTAHIDEMCRFITPNKILLAEVSDEEAASSKAGAESRRRIDAAYEILRAETDWEGKPFEIVRMPTAEPIEVVIAPGDEDYELYKASSTKWAASSWMAPLGPKAPFTFMPQQATATSSSATASFLASVITTKA